MAEGKTKVGYFLYADYVLKSDLTANAKIVLFVIANHYNWTKKNPTWVSHGTIAKESGLSVSTVKRLLKALLEAGWLTHAGYKAISNGIVNQFKPSTPNELSPSSNEGIPSSNSSDTQSNWDSDLTHKQITNIEIFRTNKQKQRSNSSAKQNSLPPFRWLRKTKRII